MDKKLKELLDNFRADRVLLLTPEDEELIIRHLTKKDFIDNGSSRAVYSLGESFVVKLAMSTGGITQNEVEYGFYMNNRGPFATMFAHGKLMNIMEYVEDCSFYDAYDYDEESDTAEVIEILNEITGIDTADNGQLGISSITGELVAYDYGYSGSYDHHELVDNVGWWIDTIDPLENALRILETGEVPSRDELDDFTRY